MKLTQITKYVWIGSLMFVLIGSLCSHGEAESLQVGFFSIEPHTIVESPDNYTGAAIEYFSRIAELMGITQVNFQNFPLPRLVLSLEQEKIDVILFLAKNPERESKFQYPEEPFYLSQTGLAVSSASSLQSISSVEELFPLKIGILAKGYLSPLMRHEQLQLDPLYGNSPMLRNLKKVLENRIDAVYVPDLAVIQFEAQKNGYDTQFRYLTLPEAATANYSVFSKQSAEKYLSRYEEALRELQKTLPYEQFLKDYITAAKQN